MSIDPEVPESENYISEQRESSPASLLVEAVAATVALAFTILLLREVLPFLN